jgi:uncharacterized membrane protein
MSGGVRFFSDSPRSLIFIILLVGLAIILIPLMILGIIGAAFTRLGFSWISALAVVICMVLGSFVNIPFYRIQRDMVKVPRNETSGFDVCGPCPPSPVWDTSVSINFGGAVIPTFISLYMVYGAIGIMGFPLIITIVVATFLVGMISFLSTRLVTCSGLQVPLLIPGMTALFAGLILTGGTGLTAAVTAFVSGTAGVLLGGNIANFHRIKNLEVTAVSFGGAGTFGSIFICCILPALIA